MREYDISNTVAIVTGGSKGIGYAIVKDLAVEGLLQDGLIFKEFVI